MPIVVKAFAATGKFFSFDFHVRLPNGAVHSFQVTELDMHAFCDSFDAAVFALFEEVVNVSLKKTLTLIRKVNGSDRVRHEMAFVRSLENQHGADHPYLFELLSSTDDFGSYEYGTCHFAGIHEVARTLSA